ncbi:probable U3 small nucleolar RNA-associated protein 11 [Primulina eburnea]|uniref:probable U3 small nucleolar RNA-associated protein 11 n=1 Tax=Primulina eburnea TaxID=1245227 RepID=UPI003C6BD6D2
MSSLRNAIPRKAHKERAQPHLRRKFGLLEKHKDYVIHARAYHQKEQTLLKLKEKAALRNPDEFYFKMIKTKIVGGVHKPESQANNYTNEELMLMKTQDIGYILQKLQTEKRKLKDLMVCCILLTISHHPNMFIMPTTGRRQEKYAKKFQNKGTHQLLKTCLKLF